MNQITWPWRVRKAITLIGVAIGMTLSGIQAQAQSVPPESSGKAEITYRSVFDGYQKYSDQSVVSWSASNTTVGKIGGWRVYAKEARQPDAAENTEKTSAPPQKSGAHEGHGGKP
jgi:hypothetical protein